MKIKTPIQEILDIIENQQRYVDSAKTATTNLKIELKRLLEKEKIEMSKAFEQGKQAQWEEQNIKKGLQSNNISFDKYYSERYSEAE